MCGLDVLTDEPASRITPYRPGRKMDQIRADQIVRRQGLHFAIFGLSYANHCPLPRLDHGRHQFLRSMDEKCFRKEQGMLERGKQASEQSKKCIQSLNFERA